MKNEYHVTWKLYKSWTIENMLKGKKLAFIIYWFVLGIILLGMGIADGVHTFPIMLAVFCLYRAFFRNLLFARKQYNTLAKTYGQENWKRVILFEEEQITLTEGTISAQFFYGDIVDIREKEDKIWLTFKNQSVMRLYQSAFFHTNWEECKSKILLKREQICSKE